VQHEHVGDAAVAPRLAVRRRAPKRGERAVGGCCHALLFLMLRSGRKAASRSMILRDGRVPRPPQDED